MKKHKTKQSTTEYSSNGISISIGSNVKHGVVTIYDGDNVKNNAPAVPAHVIPANNISSSKPKPSRDGYFASVNNNESSIKITHSKDAKGSILIAGGNVQGVQPGHHDIIIAGGNIVRAPGKK